MLTDMTLVDEARSGGIALERLIAAIWPDAYRIALSVLRDRGLAEDAAQDACAKIAASLGQLNAASSFAAWSYRLITREALSAARRRRSVDALDDIPQPGVHFDGTDAIDLYDALGKLPIVQRAVVILHYYAGFNSSEIAAAAGLPASTVRFYLMRARKALRKMLSNDAPALAAREEVVHDVH